MKKLHSFILVLFLFIGNIFSQEVLTAPAKKYIDDFMALRVTLTTYKDKTQAASQLEKYKNSNVYSDFSVQTKLIIDTFYLLEKYNYIWENKANDNMLKTALLKQITLNEAFIEKNPSKVNDWLYVLTADTMSCYMSYNPMGSALKYGMKVKDYYEKCLSINPKNSYCLTHYGQWFYWAPAINGGSKKKALNNFINAVTYSTTNADKFYAYLFLSQMYFDQKDSVSAKNNLAKAKTYCPNSEYIKEIEKYNLQGYSMFTYSKKKAEDEKRISD